LVTPDEIQRLMSGYATGSLTESERNLLFDAALEDQHLFDQLAQEQALKELIDQPGARDRLIAALAPADPSQVIGAWKKPLAWGLAAMFVVSMSVAALMLTRSGIRTQIAQKRVDEVQVPQSSQPSASPAAAAPGSAAPAVSGSPASPPAKEQHDRRSTASENGRRELDAEARARPNAPTPAKSQTVDGQNVANDKLEPVQAAKKSGRANSRTGSVSGSGSGPDPKELSKNDELRKTAGSATAPSPAPSPGRPQITPQSQAVGQLSQPPGAQPQGFVAGQLQGVPQAPPDRQTTQSTNGQVESAQTQSGQDAGRVQTARSQAQTGPNQVQSAPGGGGGGGRGAAGGGDGGAGVGGAAIARRAARVPASVPARFAFDYSIDGEDLVFKFSADGYFSLHIAPGGLTIVDSRVAAGSTRREHITANGTEAVIVFSALPQSDAQGVSIETRARSLTAEDPARKRIEVLVKFY
jgi:hypothetical protein